jgi:hypothetical protein
LTVHAHIKLMAGRERGCPSAHGTGRYGTCKAFAAPTQRLRNASPLLSGDQPRRREYQPRKAQTPVSMMMSPRRIASCDTCAAPRRAVVSTSLVHLAQGSIR